jgi:hypothetical protein
MSKDIDLNALSEWAESDAPLTTETAETLHGEEARAAGLRALEGAAETPDEVAAVRSLGGRPSLDPKGETEIWRVRVPATLDKDFKEVAAEEHTNLSALLRKLAGDYVHERQERRAALAHYLEGVLGEELKAIFPEPATFLSRAEAEKRAEALGKAVAGLVTIGAGAAKGVHAGEVELNTPESWKVLAGAMAESTADALIAAGWDRHVQG